MSPFEGDARLNSAARANPHFVFSASPMQSWRACPYLVVVLHHNVYAQACKDVDVRGDKDSDRQKHIALAI